MWKHVLLVALAVFLAAVVVEHNTTPPGRDCVKISTGVHYNPDLRPPDKRYEEGFREECTRKTGAISAALQHVYEQLKPFFKWIGEIIARLSDFLYWIEEYVWAAQSILQRLLMIGLSGFHIITGYWEYVTNVSWGWRIVLGTVLAIAGLLLAVERKTQWLNRGLDWCNKKLQEDEACYRKEKAAYETRPNERNA